MDKEYSEIFWRQRDIGSEVKYRMQFLGRLACKDEAVPYVANGIVANNDLETKEAENFLALLVLEGLDAGTCPGAIGISDETMAQLHEWAPEWKPKAERDKAVAPAVSP